MKTASVISSIVLILVLLRSVPAGAEDAGIADAVAAALREHVAATTKEDIEAVMATIHPGSPARQGTRQTLAEVFLHYDLSYELVSQTFIAESGPYAIVRAEMKAIRLAGRDFRNNSTDSLQVFRREGDAWKLWQSTILETRYLE